MRRFVSFGPAFVVLLSALAVLLTLPGAVSRIMAERAKARVAVARADLDRDPVLDQLNNAIRKVADAIEPSVVHIEVLSRSPDLMRSSSGAGWVFDDQGHVITNAHVVASAERIQVQFFDGRLAEAEVLGADPAADVAVLKVPSGPHLIPARRATGERVYRGDRVFAFGSPFGYKFSMSEGIVSGLGRTARAVSGFAGLSNFIQTDAAVNPGNSGGPLVDFKGRVIGMNVAIATASQADGTTEGQSSGISFAIPLETVERRVEQFMRSGKPESGWIGIEYRPNQAYGKDDFEGRGLMVLSVLPDGGAERAGIKVGDFLTAINGQPLVSDDVLRAIVGSSTPGTVVTFDVWRQGESFKIDVTLGDVPRSQQIGRARMELFRLYGLMLQTAEEGGVIAMIPEPDSPAGVSGFVTGDRVIAVSDKEIATAEEAFSALIEAGALLGKSVEITVEANPSDSVGQSNRRTILLQR